MKIHHVFMAGLCLVPTLAHAELPCQSFDAGEPFKFESEIFEEISGMALSHRNPNYIWTHVDSDGPASLFLIDHSGALVHTYPIEGVTNIDWEDIAVGACPESPLKSCIFIADTGDNLFSRTDKKILIVEEPEIPESIQSGETTLSLLDVQWFVYPKTEETEARYLNPDCESLMVHPMTGAMYLVSKQSTTGYQTLYRVPRKTDKITTLVPLSSYTFTSALGSIKEIYNATTGADFAPDGKRFAVRTYATIYEYDLEKYGTLADAFQHPETRFVTAELQGESIAYDSDGYSFITSGEKYQTLNAATMSLFRCVKSASWVEPESDATVSVYPDSVDDPNSEHYEIAGDVPDDSTCHAQPLVAAQRVGGVGILSFFALFLCLFRRATQTSDTSDNSRQSVNK